MVPNKICDATTILLLTTHKNTKPKFTNSPCVFFLKFVGVTHKKFHPEVQMMWGAPCHLNQHNMNANTKMCKYKAEEKRINAWWQAIAQSSAFYKNYLLFNCFRMGLFGSSHLYKLLMERKKERDRDRERGRKTLITWQQSNTT